MSSFCMTQCGYLGYHVGGGLVQVDRAKVEAVETFAVPNTKKDVRSFLGLAGYYSKFIPNYASTAAPLTDLTRKNSPAHVHWTGECSLAFGKLKTALSTAPVLQAPDMQKEFVLQTDASDRSVGAVLSQRDEHDAEHPVAYYSRKLLYTKRRTVFHH